MRGASAKRGIFGVEGRFRGWYADRICGYVISTKVGAVVIALSRQAPWSQGGRTLPGPLAQGTDEQADLSNVSSEQTPLIVGA